VPELVYVCILTVRGDFSWKQFQSLYGKKAAALYTQAGDYQKTARFYYKKAEDTYYQVPPEHSFRVCTRALVISAGTVCRCGLERCGRVQQSHRVPALGDTSVHGGRVH